MNDDNRFTTLIMALVLILITSLIILSYGGYLDGNFSNHCRSTYGEEWKVKKIYGGRLCNNPGTGEVRS